MELHKSHGHFRCKFSPAEDLKLRQVVEQVGAGDWASVASHMAPRNARQCRERWTNYLNPSLVNAPWTASEESLLEEKFAEFGTKWQVIAVFFPSRSKNDIKNHWISNQRNLLTWSVDADRPAMPDCSPPNNRTLKPEHVLHVPQRIEAGPRPPVEPSLKLGSISSFLNDGPGCLARMSSIPSHRLIKIV
jgi:hypothetical protein